MKRPVYRFRAPVFLPLRALPPVDVPYLLEPDSGLNPEIVNRQAPGDVLTSLEADEAELAETEGLGRPEASLFALLSQSEGVEAGCADSEYRGAGFHVAGRVGPPR